MQSLSILVECSSSAYKHLRLHRSSEICTWNVVLTTCQDGGRGLRGGRLIAWQNGCTTLFKKNKHTFGPADTGQIKSPGSAATLQATLQATLHFCQSDINRESYAGDFSSEIPRQICSHLLEAKMQWETRPIARGQFLT